MQTAKDGTAVGGAQHYELGGHHSVVRPVELDDAKDAIHESVPHGLQRPPGSIHAPFGADTGIRCGAIEHADERAVGAPEGSGQRIAGRLASFVALDGIQRIRGAVFSDEAATPRCPVGKFAHFGPLAGDGGMLHLPKVTADHVVENTQHDADPADVVAEQRGQCRVHRILVMKCRSHRPPLTAEKIARRPRRQIDRGPRRQTRFGTCVELVGKLLG